MTEPEEIYPPFWWREARRRARNGIALLNERGPEGWLRRVNVLALDMGHPSRDLLGQLYESYYRGMTALFGDDWDQRIGEVDQGTGKSFAWFGFAAVSEISCPMLTNAWRKELWALNLADERRIS
jgi:hypothetical protein